MTSEQQPPVTNDSWDYFWVPTCRCNIEGIQYSMKMFKPDASDRF